MDFLTYHTRVARLSLSLLQPKQRLLEAPQCYLDRIDGWTEEVRSHSNVYWLCYDKSADRQWVSPMPPSHPHVHVHTLRLELRTPPSGTVLPRNPTTTSSSNVGTTLLWDDDRVHIWEFRIAPGECCQYHTHHLEYCFTNLTQSTTQALNDKGEATEDEPNLQRVGQTVFVNMDSLGSHAVRNVGPSTFLQFIVEFKYVARE